MPLKTLALASALAFNTIIIRIIFSILPTNYEVNNFSLSNDRKTKDLKKTGNP